MGQRSRRSRGVLRTVSEVSESKRRYRLELVSHGLGAGGEGEEDQGAGRGMARRVDT